MGGVNSIEEIKEEIDGEFLIKKIYKDDTLMSEDKFKIKELHHVNFSNEEWNKIKGEKEKDIDFCITDNNFNGITECMGLFSDTNSNYASVLDEFRVVKGPTKCYTYYFRPGLVFKENNIDNLKEKLSVLDGKLCRLSYQDYNYNDDDLKRCCLTDDQAKCNKNLINNYDTTHCDSVMINECKTNPENSKCILWLEKSYKRSNDIALETYYNICKENFDKPYCNYFCKISRINNDYRSIYCDNALKYWCDNNPNDERCFCVLTPNNIIPEIQEYLGPKECWLSSCASQLENKWLLTDQLETRSNCNLTSCIIDIKQLTMNEDSKLSLINDCISGVKTNSYLSSTVLNNKEDNNLEKIYTPGILFNPELLLFVGSIILLLLFL